MQQQKVMTSLLFSRLRMLLKNEDFMKLLALYLCALNIENVLETYNPISLSLRSSGVLLFSLKQI